MNARVTLIGFERELNEVEKSIIDTWDLNNEHYDKETLLSAIIMRGGRFEPLYADPEYFYLMCGFWWNKWKGNFDKWFDVLDAEYNPIHNWNKFESWHEDVDDVGTDDTSTTARTVVDEDLTHSNTITDNEVMHDEGTAHEVFDGTEQLSGTDEVDHDYDKDVNVEHTVSAFDSSNPEYLPHSNDHTDDTLNYENTDTTYGRRTDTDNVTDTETEEDRTTDNTRLDTGSATDDITTNQNSTVENDTTNQRDIEHEGHSYGNIGVTTTQKMIQEELEVRKWNTYNHMADIFINELLIGVY